MEIKEHIKKVMELTDDPEIDFAAVQQKIQDVSKVLNHLNALKDDTEYACWNKWLNRLKQEYPNYKIIDYSTDKKLPKTGVIMKHNNIEFAVLIERDSNIYYGIGRHDCTQDLNEDIKVLSDRILSEIGGFKTAPWWYGWTFTSFQNGYERLVELIRSVENAIKK